MQKKLSDQKSQQDQIILKRSFNYTFSFVAVIWLVKIIESLFSIDFGFLGIMPRTFEGSVGIFFAPLVHGDFFHLLSNSFPLILLGVGLFYFYHKVALNVVMAVYMISGFWVWLIAREAYHIGASGLVYGLLAFLLVSGFLRKDKSALALSFIILVLYGGTFISGVFPSTPGISWESHLMGAIAGVFCAIYYRKTNVVVDQNSEVVQSTPNPTYKYVYKAEEDGKQSYSYTYGSNTANDKVNDTN